MVNYKKNKEKIINNYMMVYLEQLAHGEAAQLHNCLALEFPE